MSDMSSVSSRSRRFGALVALLFLAACGRDGFLTAPNRSAQLVPEPPAHYPIIFVHGYNGSANTWATMISRFKLDGYTTAELVNWSYDYRQSNAVTASKLSAKVDSVLAATGAHRVSIVSHSMGVLPARYYVRNLLLSMDTRVDAIVSLGGTNHGTATAFGCTPISCSEMRPYSSFLLKLNYLDQTWGTPRYATWWSACDEVIYPTTNAKLSGAINTQTACLRHSQLHQDYTVYTQVRDFVSLRR